LFLKKKPRRKAGLKYRFGRIDPSGGRLQRISAAERPAIAPLTPGRPGGPAPAPRNDPGGHALAMMDKETKHEMWLLAVGTALLEMPVVAIVAVMMLTH
jgi:hypothetical protein